MNQFMFLMLPSFENGKIKINKPLKILAPCICKVINKYAYKNNNLILLFSLIHEIAIILHLSGNVKNVNIVYDLFWEYGYHIDIFLLENIELNCIYYAAFKDNQVTEINPNFFGGMVTSKTFHIFMLFYMIFNWYVYIIC